MGVFFLLSVFGLLAAVGVSSHSASDGEDVDGAGNDGGDEPLDLMGVVGQEDILMGGNANDTLEGNQDEADILNGGGGDDLLIVRDGNIATGGAGSDVFDISTGNKGVITDFDPEEDRLQILFRNSEEVPNAAEQVSWRITDEGVELHVSQEDGAKLSGDTHLVTLLGLSGPPAGTTLVFGALS